MQADGDIRLGKVHETTAFCFDRTSGHFIDPALTERGCHFGDDPWRGQVGISVDQPDEVVGQDFIRMNRVARVAPDLLEPSRGVRWSKQARAAGDPLRHPVRAVRSRIAARISATTVIEGTARVRS